MPTKTILKECDECDKCDSSLIPHGMTEQEVTDIIHRVARRFSYKFRFGYHDTEDIYQQSSLFACEALPRFTPGRNLEKFLNTHVKNRLCNYKRDNFERLNSPCEECKKDNPPTLPSVSVWTYENKMTEEEKINNPNYKTVGGYLKTILYKEAATKNIQNASCSSNESCKNFTDIMDCQTYRKWISRNSLKRNLMMPIEMGEVQDERERNMSLIDDIPNAIITKEASIFMDKHLPIALRHDYIKYKLGITLEKHRRIKLNSTMKEIAREFLETSS